MATVAHITARRASATPAPLPIARRFELRDHTDQAWHRETRIGRPFEVRFFGQGFHVRCDGQSLFYCDRDEALDAAAAWLDLGVTRFTLWGRDVTRAEFLDAHPELAPALEMAA